MELTQGNLPQQNRKCPQIRIYQASQLKTYQKSELELGINLIADSNS